MDQSRQRRVARAFAVLTPMSPTELSTVSVGYLALGEQEQIAGREAVLAELAHPHPIAVFRQKEGPVQHQPELQGAAEQVAHQLQVAHFGQALPAGGFQGAPVPLGGGGQLAQLGQVAAVLDRKSTRLNSSHVKISY